MAKNKVAVIGSGNDALYVQALRQADPGRVRRPLAGLPRIDTAGPGDYRLRVHARNRDVPAFDSDGAESSADEYLIVSWPEASRPPWLIRLTDMRGAGVRYPLPPDHLEKPAATD